MTTAFDVPPGLFLEAVAPKLQSDPKCKPPEWATWVKTGTHHEKAPTNSQWWHLRVASILRRVYVDGPIGVVHLSAKYGGSRDRGSKPNRARSGSRSIVRAALKQLEGAGYVVSIKGKGRILTGKGRSLLDNTAHEVAQRLEVQIPALKKY